MKVSPKTRQRILDGLRLERVQWSGALDELEFISRIFNLHELPSHDSRFSDAHGDIWKHRIVNDDWSDDWIFGDRRFDLLGCTDEVFLEFLAQMVHPVVRPIREEAIQLVARLNDALRVDGIELVEEGSIFGRPEYVARSLTRPPTYLEHARLAADVLDAGWMAREVLRLERAIDADPDDALRGAKELVESCCKSILEKRGIPRPSGLDMGKLTRMTLSELKLTRDDIPDSARAADDIRNVLSALATISSKVADLRNLYGTGHGRAGNYQGLQPRHARLAVMAAVTFITFATDTFREQQTGRRKAS